MSELKVIDGDSVTINDNALSVIEYKGVRVISPYEIARLHGKQVRHVNQQFKRNKERFQLNIDYFVISKEEFLGSLTTTQIFIPNSVKEIKLFTERGYLKLVKSFSDELSWKVQDLLMAKYFQAIAAFREISDISIDLSQNVVVYKDGHLVTTSNSIAYAANKRHDNVLRDIENELNLLKNEEIRTPELKVALNSVINGIKEISYIDSRGRIQKSYELSEEASYQMLLKYSPAVRALFIYQFKTLRDSLINMFKVKVLDSVLPEYKGKRQYVYIIKNLSSGNIKIGVGSDPQSRLAQLQTGSDAELSLVYTSFLCSNAFDLEAKTHKHFEQYRVRGEWFSIDESAVISFLENSKFILTSEFVKLVQE